MGPLLWIVCHSAHRNLITRAQRAVTRTAGRERRSSCLPRSFWQTAELLWRMEARRTDHRRFDAPRHGHSVPPQGTYPSMPQSSGLKSVDEAANLKFQVLVLMIYQTCNPLQSSKRSTFSASGDESAGNNQRRNEIEYHDEPSPETHGHVADSQTRGRLPDTWQTPRHVAKATTKSTHRGPPMQPSRLHGEGNQCCGEKSQITM